MKRLSRDKRCKGTFLFLIAIISFLGLAVLSISPVSDMPNVSAATELKSSHVATPCKNQEPTDQSLLVVMLDRSGSLIGPPGYATDPNLYSTSVTNALADLWPGKMAVIPFSGDVTQLPVFGPVTLSDPAQRADLKDKVNRYHIGGGTPTSTAMRQALTVLDNAPCGSRAIIITDGAPSGTPPGGIPGNKQIPDIENNLIPQFHQSGIPVSAFGLTISDSNAVTLLTDIAAQTGGEYQPVTDPKDLARSHHLRSHGTPGVSTGNGS